MKAASVKEIKSALENIPPKELLDICVRLVKFKKENKELATYILFDETDEIGYVKNVKSSLELLFEDVNKTNPYFAKKTLRKIVRVANRYIKYSNEATTEVEVLLFVAESIRNLHLDMSKSTSLENIYLGLIKKIKKTVQALHEDLQYDYLKQLQ
jgi:uncharacterized membrane protein YgaE (UPF0421/DUF939 family)